MNIIKDKVLNALKKSTHKEQILEYLHFSENEVSASLFPGGIPKLFRENDSYTLITGYDDMRGPQGLYRNLNIDTAVQKLIAVLERTITISQDHLFYHPEDANVITDEKGVKNK